MSAPASVPAEGELDASLEAPGTSPTSRRHLTALAELLAVGGLGVLVFPLAWLLRRTLGLSEAELAVGFVMFHAAHVINDPHFAVTYLLFYKDVRARSTSPSLPRAQRVRYVVSGFVVPLLLLGWGAGSLALGSAEGIGLVVQLMYLLVGWHYGKQGFGVLTVLSARRGFRFSDRERKFVLGFVYAAWAYAWASPAMPAGAFEERGVVYSAPARPELFATVTGLALAAAAVGLVVALVSAYRRERRLPLVPLVGFLVTIVSWTVWTTADRLVQYVIPALHSIQYLYFVWLLRRNEARAAEGPPTFGPPAATRVAWLAGSSILLGYVLLRGGPELLDTAYVPAPEARASLGATPVFALLYTSVNVHHYFMDHVLWRRENPDTRHLATDPPLPSAPA